MVLHVPNGGTKFSLSFVLKGWFSKTEMGVPISSFQKESENSAAFKKIPLKVHHRNSANSSVNINPFIDQGKKLSDWFGYFFD